MRKLFTIRPKYLQRLGRPYTCLMIFDPKQLVDTYTIAKEQELISQFVKAESSG